jgi:Kef-type K+ transport system membrane component KefB
LTGGSRLSGLDPRQSAATAALVNTRGLTEIIALNVGLSVGIIHQRLFTVLVVMALITTIMTSPLLSVIGVSPARPALGEQPEASQASIHFD